MKNVNVLLYRDEPVSITSYPDTEKGNKRAREVFVSAIKHSTYPEDPTPEQLEKYVEEGEYRSESGLKVYLVKSDMEWEEIKELYMEAMK